MLLVAGGFKRRGRKEVVVDFLEKTGKTGNQVQGYFIRGKDSTRNY